MKRISAALFLAMSFVVCMSMKLYAGGNLLEMRDANNVTRIVIDSSGNLKETKLGANGLVPGQFSRGNFVFPSSVTINNLIVFGSTNTDGIQGYTCSGLGCMVLNVDDLDLYTSTGTNWRNTRTGLEIAPLDPIPGACDQLDTCLGYESFGIALTDALNLCQAGSPGCGGDTALCTSSAMVCCVDPSGNCY